MVPLEDQATPVIRFYRVHDRYGEFSNFAPFPVELDGLRWPTSEHYFQAAKFIDEGDRERVRTEPSPMQAARLGRDRSRPIRADWDQVRDLVMERALDAKFRQHDSLRLLLLGTGSSTLVEHTVNDRYWGDGGDGTGVNRLGQLLMELRDRLRAEIVDGP